MKIPALSRPSALQHFKEHDFEAAVWATFHHQYETNPVYRAYADLVHKDPDRVSTIEAIPFLPIGFFKSHEVVSGGGKAEKIFTSSGTTGTTPSQHFVTDLQWYEHSFSTAFEQCYGPAENYAFLALLPAYMEREGSSLLYMMDALMKKSKHPKNGFFLDDHQVLAQTLQELEAAQQPTLLIGVTYALLDFVTSHQFQLNHTTIMETGGMKGRRKEMVRAAVHRELQAGFGVDFIHSEYGMTELLSQAYSKGNGWFECPPWMRVLLRDPADPFHMVATQQTGGINIIDLANQNSCAFIATEDLGRKNAQGQFEVLGRFDAAELRGCNLMVV